MQDHFYKVSLVNEVKINDKLSKATEGRVLGYFLDPEEADLVVNEQTERTLRRKIKFGRTEDYSDLPIGVVK